MRHYKLIMMTQPRGIAWSCSLMEANDEDARATAKRMLHPDSLPYNCIEVALCDTEPTADSAMREIARYRQVTTSEIVETIDEGDGGDSLSLAQHIVPDEPAEMVAAINELDRARREEAEIMSEIDRYNTIADANKFVSRWSIDGTDFDAPHPFVKYPVIRYHEHNHWGEETVYRPVEGPTWLDVWKAADAAIRASGDLHHVFIEELVEVEGDTSVVDMNTGS